MKKVINGKMYNTETAKFLAAAEYKYRGDLYFCREELYQKKTGEFFLHGEGGPATKYAESCGIDAWTSGEDIMPLTYKAATKWAEENVDADKYEEIFGEVEENESKKAVTLSLQTSLVENLKRKAAEEGKQLSKYIEDILKEIK
ncbi:MAG: hypothetical protein [Inoviridae sp.]|nr:MAG: hypothetical protein [Inoviridae sp.]